MAESENNVYFVVKDENGENFLCPVDRIKNRQRITDEEMLNCVEKDVAERYSGNIDIDG